MGTVELTGLEMMFTIAFGQYLATPSARVFTMPALVLNKSSRVIPGLRGTPAGITTTSQPVRAFLRSSPEKPSTVPFVDIWDKSTATPGVIGATSKQVNSETRGFF